MAAAPAMPHLYPRTIHFADTDAAGVVFFANVLAICHEAYEEALAGAGIELGAFFRSEAVIVPVAKSEASYLRPLAVGDKVEVSLAPAPLGEDSYEIRFELTSSGRPERPGKKPAARVRTEHVCIDAATRRRRPLPAALAAWVRSG